MQLRHPQPAQIVAGRAVPGKTFQYGANGPEGLLGAKRVIIASTRGGYYGADTPMAALEHQESHLRSFLGFLGITELEIVRAEGVRSATTPGRKP
jgi:FMN-dependent NADH-azoreductase